MKPTRSQRNGKAAELSPGPPPYLSRLKRAFASRDEEAMVRLIRGLLRAGTAAQARTPLDKATWLAFELATGCGYPALLRAEEVAKLLGIHVDLIPALETNGVLVSAGRPKRKSVKLYVLRHVVELRGDPARLNLAVTAIRRRVERKNRKKGPLPSPAPATSPSPPV